MNKSFFPVLITLFSSTAFAADSCPNDFPTFLNRFGIDRAFQESNTKYPLRYTSNTAHTESCDYPDCPFVEDKLSRQQAVKLSEPIFPLVQTQQEMSLEKRIERSKDQTLVKIRKPDSDSYSFEFIFKRSKSCWKLVSVIDYSI